VIGNPIEPVSIEVRKNWSLSNRFIAVGRLTEAKDFSFLISCYKLYRNQGGRKELDIFGTGPLSDSLAQQIDFEGLGRYLKIRQPVRDISSEYINSSIFLSSSLVEGFPLTLCEAMQHGLPCIGRGLCSGVNSLISHNLSGLLSSAESVELEKENYASLMILAERDPMLLDRLRENALLKLLEYSSENVLGQWEDFINSSSL
jgi:glycosyltransferase involved in cell wall biosynthesis